MINFDVQKNMWVLGLDVCRFLFADFFSNVWKVQTFLIAWARPLWLGFDFVGEAFLLIKF
jgi:hypothetical protein